VDKRSKNTGSSGGSSAGFFRWNVLGGVAGLVECKFEPWKWIECGFEPRECVEYRFEPWECWFALNGTDAGQYAVRVTELSNNEPECIKDAAEYGIVGFDLLVTVGTRGRNARFPRLEHAVAV